MNACKNNNDCSELLKTHMTGNLLDKKYKIVNNGEGRMFYQGINSKKNKVSILTPIKNALNLDIFINGKQSSFRLPDALTDGTKTQEWLQLVS